MDSTPITLSHVSSMQVAVQLFEKLVCFLSCLPLTTGSAICATYIERLLDGIDHQEGRHSKHNLPAGGR